MCIRDSVSDKLLNQFVACLEEKLRGGPRAGSPANGTPPDSASAAALAAGGDEAGGPRWETGPGTQDDVLDLGATVLPALARTYWKQAVGLVLVLLVLRRLLRRR